MAYPDDRPIEGLPGVAEVEFDFCALGMKSSDEHGPAPVKKRTRIITNCPELVRALKERQCTKDHRHVPLVHGRASACQEYPMKFCRVVCRAVAVQADKDKKTNRSHPRKRAVISSITNARVNAMADASGSQKLRNMMRVTRHGNWAKEELDKACAGQTVEHGHGSSVESTDCTELMEALTREDPEAAPFYKGWSKESRMGCIQEGGRSR